MSPLFAIAITTDPSAVWGGLAAAPSVSSLGRLPRLHQLFSPRVAVFKALLQTLLCNTTGMLWAPC